MAKNLPLKPVNDFLLVEITDTKYSTSVGELDVANMDENESIQKGVCVDVGDGKYRAGSGWAIADGGESKNALIGKVILWQKYADKDATFDYDGKKYVLVKVSQVVAYEQ